MAGWFGLLPRACPELTMGVRASSPIEFVQAAKVFMSLISGFKVARKNFGVDCEVVRAADRVPRSLCYDITNLSRLRRRSGKTINQTVRIIGWLLFLSQYL
jgi:hypothetical protein